MNAANKFLNLIVYFIYPLFIIWPKLKYLENVLKDKNKLLICGKNFGCYIRREQREAELVDRA